MKNAHIATAKGTNIPISRKNSIEIASFIRGKDVSKIKKTLENVLKEKTAVPFKRFNKDRGHKKGPIAAGRFPKKATKEILKLIESAEANAQNKGLNSESLTLSTIVVNKGTTQWRHGRQRRRQRKMCHIEVTVEEKEEKKKATKKEEPKKIEKTVKEKKDTPKKEETKEEKK
ncbi:MAG: 50S ribosomal protein L22 [archaeon]